MPCCSNLAWDGASVNGSTFAAVWKLFTLFPSSLPSSGSLLGPTHVKPIHHPCPFITGSSWQNCRESCFTVGFGLTKHEYSNACYHSDFRNAQPKQAHPGHQLQETHTLSSHSLSSTSKNIHCNTIKYSLFADTWARRRVSCPYPARGSQIRSEGSVLRYTSMLPSSNSVAASTLLQTI